MPYVKQERRASLDVFVERINTIFEKYEASNWARILYSFCKQLTPSYNTYKNYFGELTEAAAEICRRHGVNEYVDNDYPPDIDVTDEERADIADLVDAMVSSLKVDGDLNYVIFAWQERHLILTAEREYFFSEIEALVGRMRTDFLAPYEDEKIKENGDVT